MYKYNYFLMAGIILLLNACNSTNLSVGSKKDFGTGLSISWDGLNVEDAYLMDANKKERIGNNKVDMNQLIAIVVTGVEGFTEKNGKVNPGIDIKLSNEKGELLLDAKDLLKQEVEKEKAKVLDASLTIGAPMEVGKKYLMKARFYDKNGKGEINSEIELEVK